MLINDSLKLFIKNGRAKVKLKALSKVTQPIFFPCSLQANTPVAFD
jgi:hypothetical protein